MAPITIVINKDVVFKNRGFEPETINRLVDAAKQKKHDGSFPVFKSASELEFCCEICNTISKAQDYEQIKTGVFNTNVVIAIE